MIARIVDNKWIYLESISPHEDEEVSKYFSARHPKAMYINTQYDWDGWYRKYNSKEQKLNRAFLLDLAILCRDKGFPLEIHDIRGDPKYKHDPAELINNDYINGITLEQYQVDSIRAACKHEIGLIEVPTGGGKTEVMCGIVKSLNCPTMLLADITVVIDQIKERLELREIVEEVGVFYSGKTPTNQLVCVGSIQSVSTPPKPKKPELVPAYRTRLKNAKKYQQLAKSCELLIVDEADKAVSKQYQTFFKHYFNGRYKYGMSATPFDKDEIKNLILREHLGNIIYHIDRAPVQKTGRIIPIAYNMICCGYDGNRNDHTAYDIATNELINNNEEFHKLVCKIATSFPDDGTLILVESIPLGESLQKLMPDKSIFIYGKTTKTARQKYINMFEEREIPILIGGKIVKRGFDLKNGCENLILCGCSQKESEVIQQIGRALRRNKRGRGRVFDFCFLNNYYLYKHSRARLRTVVEGGFKTKVIFKNQEFDGKEVIDGRFKQLRTKIPAPKRPKIPAKYRRKT